MRWSRDLLTLLQAIFWLAVGVMVYTFLGYPLLIGLLARCMQRPVRRAEITPPATLIIPAYNEASVIARKIENSLGLDYPSDRLEVVVITDGSDDGTVDVVSSYAERGVRLYHQPQRQGKAAAINRVVPLVSGEILVFSDANTMIEPGALRALVRSFADPAVGGVSGEKQVQGGGEGLYWRYESYLKRCDSALTSVMGAAGEFFAVRRELFRPTEEDSVIEDFVLSLRLVEAGWRVWFPGHGATAQLAQSRTWVGGVAILLTSRPTLGGHALPVAGDLWPQSAAGGAATLPVPIPGADGLLCGRAAWIRAHTAWNTWRAAALGVLLLLRQRCGVGGLLALSRRNSASDLGQSSMNDPERMRL
jgi:cellulose synthase/poly-beta-1,6-N-acetylglucosamine synthase-like glycosyltransferase